MRLLQGRDIEANDTINRAGVAIVTQSFARTYFQGNPLGKRFSTMEDKDGRHECMQIIGIVNDVHDHAIPGIFRLPPSYYMPLHPGEMELGLVTRTSVNPMAMAAAVERIVRSVDDHATIKQLETLDQVIADSSAEPRFQAVLLGSFGVLGLLLATIGIYGVLSYSVVQRTHEIGMRMALGARPRDIARLFLGEGILLAAAGIAIGVAGAFGLTRFLQSLLFEVKPTDPITFIGVVIFLGLVALAACYIPARRAMRVDPMVALKYE
jgi:putative ABC transport system permease protein